jgi:hypothetical protein
MKRYLWLIVFSAALVNADAQSALKVSLTDKSRISVELDYNHFRKVGTSITVGDVPAGRHSLRIYEERTNRFGREVHDLIYEGKVKTYADRITLFELDAESGSINVYDEDMASYDQNPSIQPDSEGQAGGQMAQAQKPAAMPVYRGIDQGKMNALKARVDAVNADSRKIVALKEGLVGQTITVEQVGEMMKWLGFESSREEFAEWAYDITANKESYETLEAKFDYEEYRQMFENFMKKQQR